MRPVSRPATPYSLQDVFNNTWHHFVVEKNPQCKIITDLEDNEGYCIYAQSGCAIGCMITIEDAQTWDTASYSAQGFGIVDVKIRFPDVYRVYFGNINEYLLQDLQRIHDKTSRFERMEQLLRNFASEHSLNVPSSMA